MAKHTTRRSAAKAARAASQERFTPTKVKFCSIVFLCCLALTGGLGVWVRAPIQQATDPLQLQLYPMEYCLTGGLNADTKSEHLESLRRDSWYFVPTYALAFIFLGMTVLCASESAWLYGAAMIVLTVFTAQCDWLENHHLEQCLDGNDAAAYAAYAWTRWKWATLSFAAAALASQFLARQDWRRILGYLLAIGGGLGTIALLPTEKVAPFLRYLLIPLLTCNLFLIWAAYAVEFVGARSQAHHRGKR
jgi:hypothetical protein